MLLYVCKFVLVYMCNTQYYIIVLLFIYGYNGCLSVSFAVTLRAFSGYLLV